MVASFLASLVEFVEALTIVLAVGTVRGWRPALTGAFAGVLLLAVLVALFGPLLTKVPLNWMQVVVGVLLLLFGMRWLRKAVLRSAGLIALHDEEKEYEKETKEMRSAGKARGYWDTVAVMASFKAVVLEGLEVVFIVIAIGAAGKMLYPATVGALVALALVVALGFLLHRPLSNVPENALKFTVGVLLSAFGTFWVGEGFGFAWPGEDLALLPLIASYLVTAVICVYIGRALIAEEGAS